MYTRLLTVLVGCKWADGRALGPLFQSVVVSRFTPLGPSLPTKVGWPHPQAMTAEARNGPEALHSPRGSLGRAAMAAAQEREGGRGGQNWPGRAARSICTPRGRPGCKNRQSLLLLLRSSSLFSFPSSQPRARREGEEEIRRAPEGEERSYTD
jgi:hypothetical protein